MFSILLYILFVLAAGVLIVVILLQEGQGGGFGQALGDHGQQTFGVGAKGINTFTGWTAAIFLMSAVLLHSMNRQEAGSSAIDSVQSLQTLPDGFNAPAAPADAGAPTDGK